MSKKQSPGDLWRTPPEVFNYLNGEFNFIADMACTHENALCTLHFTEEDNSLGFEWAKHPALQSNHLSYVWCNPPYSDPAPWIEQAKKAQAGGLGKMKRVTTPFTTIWMR